MNGLRRQCVSGYALPNPQMSSDDADRLAGNDIPSLSDLELFSESVRASAALAEAIATGCRAWLEWHEPPYAISAIDWLELRVRLLRREARRRKVVRA